MNNNNENITEENADSFEKEGYNKTTNNFNPQSSKSNSLPQMFNQVTRGDLILFKEDFLQNLKEIKNELNTKMLEKFDNCNKLIEESNKKLYNYETDKNAFVQKLNFIEEKNEILSRIRKLTIDTKNDLNLHMLHIQNVQKDLSNMGYKYDKIVTNNLMIPGIVGPMCKFSNLKDYLLSNKEQFSNINSDIQSVVDEMKQNKKRIEDLRDTLKVLHKTMEPTFQTLIDIKFGAFEKRIDEKFEKFSERLSSLRIENLASVKTILEKEKNLDEYLGKMEEIKKGIIEDNIKTVEKTRKLNNYTILKFDRNLAESNKVRKSILELANIFTKQKRIYGDDNLSEKKREVIINFSNAMSNLIKDLINNKNNNILNQISPFNKNLAYENNLELDNNVNEYIENPYLNKNNIRKNTRKLTEKAKNLYSNKKILNFLNDNINKEVAKPHKRNSLFLRSVNNNIDKFQNEKKNLNNDKVNKFEKNNINENINVKNLKFGEKVNENIDIIKDKNNIINKSDSDSSSETINFNDDKNNINNISINNDQNNNNNEFNLNIKNIQKSRNNNFNNENNKDVKKNIEKNIDNINKNKEEKNENNEINNDIIYKHKIEKNNMKKLIGFQKTEIKNNNSLNNNIYKQKNDNNNLYKNNINNDNNKAKNLEKIQNNVNKDKDNKKTSNLIYNNKDININNYNNISTPKILNDKIIQTNMNTINIENEINKNNEDINFISLNNNSQNKKNIIINNKNKEISYENKKVKNKNNDIRDYIIENKENIKKNNDTDNNSNKIDKNLITTKINNLKEIKKYISSSKYKPLENKSSIKETIISSNTDRVISRNNKINNFNISSKKDNSKDKIMMIYTERKSTNSKERISLIVESPHPKSGKKNENKNSNLHVLPESFSEKNNLFLENKKGNNRIKKRPFSKAEKINKGNIAKNNEIYTSISHRSRNIHLDYVINRYKDDNKEIYFDKKNENKINYIKDKDIIDIPLLSNQSNFEIIKERGDLENKILELEYFTKKKFDELVKEIKNFIPIHFNAYLRDYTITEIGNRQKIYK